MPAGPPEQSRDGYIASRALRGWAVASSLGDVTLKKRRGSPGFGAAFAGVLALAATAWGDVGHAHGPDEAGRAPLAVWLVGIAFTILVAVLVVRQARHRGEYVRRVLGFSRNARLLILRTPFSGLSVSIWRLLFYLYLLAAGHDTLFVA